jgi:ferric-dicitrate binding protein FerR (iron transport regulator)
MDKDFHDLLVRYVNGRCTPEDRAKVNRWYEQIEDKSLALEEMEELSMGARMRARIQRELAGDEFPSGRQRHLSGAIYKVAAAFALLTLAGLWFFTRSDSPVPDRLAQTSSPSDEVVFLNQEKTSKEYRLPDGSTVQLEPLGKIHFRKNFLEGSREVNLTGKAFFDIVKDPSRPFYVYSGAIATRVLGTTFSVDAPANATTVEVKVMTGSVSVFQVTDASREEKETHSTATGVVLSPNETVKYFVEGGHWVTGLVEDPVPVKPIEQETLSLVFENTSMRKVLADVTERYGIEVVTENEKIYQCTFTGNVSKMSLYDMLDVVSSAIGTTYEVRGTRILMSGKGCD